MFGGDLSGFGDMLSEDQKKAIANQSMLAMASKLLQAGAPSTTPTNLGSALGTAVEAGMGARQKAQSDALTGMMTKAKIQEMLRDQEFRKAISGQVQTAVPGAPLTAQQALAAQIPGGIGPTVKRAEAIGTATAPMQTEQDRLYSDLMRKYQMALQYYPSKPEVAEKYLTQAQKIKPMDEVIGQPFEVTDSSGKPLIVQQYKSGKISPLAGYGAKRDIVLQDIGGKLIAVDKSQVQSGTQFAKTMSPGEKANYGVSLANLGISKQNLELAQGKFAREGYDLKETPTGYVYVPKVPGMPTIPATDANGQPILGSGNKPTDAANNAAGFLGRMQLANSVFTSPVIGPDGKPMLDANGQPITYETAFGKPGVVESALRSLPFVGDVSANKWMESGRQEYRQAQENWVRANLRRESGAVIGADEMAKEIQNYFPQIGDSDKVIAQKAQARQMAEQGMEISAGALAKQIKLPSRPGANAQLKYNPITKKFE